MNTPPARAWLLPLLLVVGSAAPAASATDDPDELTLNGIAGYDKLYRTGQVVVGTRIVESTLTLTLDRGTGKVRGRSRLVMHGNQAYRNEKGWQLSTTGVLTREWTLEGHFDPQKLVQARGFKIGLIEGTFTMVHGFAPDPGEHPTIEDPGLASGTWTGALTHQPGYQYPGQPELKDFFITIRLERPPGDDSFGRDDGAVWSGARIELDRLEGAPGSPILLVRSSGFVPDKPVRFLWDGNQTIEDDCRVADQGNIAALPGRDQSEIRRYPWAWLFIPRDATAGTHKLKALQDDTGLESNEVTIEVSIPSTAQLASDFDGILGLYRKQVPSNPDSGSGRAWNIRNALSDSDFKCGDYQERVLRFINGLLFNEDLEVRRLMDGFDYGPLMSGPEEIRFTHHFVVIYPRKTDWRSTGVFLDPWKNQRPRAFVVDQDSGSPWWRGCSWYAPEEVESFFGHRSGWDEFTSTPRADKLVHGGAKGMNYPTHGTFGFVYPDLVHDKGYGVPKAVANGPTIPRTSVLVHCPVNVLAVERGSGRRLGTGPGGGLAQEIPGGFVELDSADPQDKLWRLGLPEGEFDLQISATGSGPVDVRVIRSDEETGHRYPVFEVSAGESASFQIGRDGKPGELVTSRGQRLTAETRALAGQGAGAPPSPGGDPGHPFEAPQVRARTGILNTLAYHQISTDGIAGQSFPILSADGTRAVFAPDAYPCPVQVIEFDGSGRRQVLEVAGPPSLLDLSADGSLVMATTPNGIEVASAAGGGQRSLLPFAAEVGHACLTGDGRRVFFFIQRPAAGPGGESVPAGLWVVGTDGGGLRLLAGQEQMRGLLGIAANEGVAWNRPCLAVSRDGSRVLFGVVSYGQANAGPKLLALRGDGSGLHLVAEGTRNSYGNVGAAEITPDGRLVAYKLVSWGQEPELGVASWEGAGARVVSRPSSARHRYPDGNTMTERITLSGDGSWLLLGSAGILVATDGSDRTYRLCETAGVGWFLLRGSLLRASMDVNARRWVFLCADERNPRLAQLATLELNPADLGRAPAIHDALVEPGYLIPDRVAARISARITADDQLVGARTTAMEHGVPTSLLSGEYLWDDGNRGGDRTAGDGLFSTPLWADRSAGVGPRNIRISAEARDADGRRHGTTVELGPVPVLTEPPDGSGGS